MNWTESFAQDLRYGTRQLKQSPGFTLVAVLSLALGIGANSAIFQLIDAVRLRTLPVQNPEELVTIDFRTGRSGRAGSPRETRGSLPDTGNKFRHGNKLSRGFWRGARLGSI